MARHRLDGFQKLALATTATTYLLILVGGLVRASGAGMGCPDWPKCFGLWIPPTTPTSSPQPSTPPVSTPPSPGPNTRTAFLGVGFQGWLGGRVVAHNLALGRHGPPHRGPRDREPVALRHGQLVLRSGRRANRRSPHRRRTATAATALIALSLLQVALGTQIRGTINAHAATLGLSRSGSLASVGWPDMAHRNLALVVFAVAAWLLWRTHTTASPVLLQRAAISILALATAQIAAGVALAYLDLPRPVQVAHLSIATPLLGAETLVALLARRA